MGHDPTSDDFANMWSSHYGKKPIFAESDYATCAGDVNDTCNKKYYAVDDEQSDVEPDANALNIRSSSLSKLICRTLDIPECFRAKNVYIDKWGYKVRFLKLARKNYITYTQRILDPNTWESCDSCQKTLLIDRIFVQVDKNYVRINAHDNVHSYRLHFGIYTFLDILGISKCILVKSNDEIKNTVVRRLSYILNGKK